MRKYIFLILAILGLTMSHHSVGQKLNSSASSSIAEVKFETTEIGCDTVYKNKSYRIILKTFNATIPESDTTYNTIFTLKKKNEILFSDSIHSGYQDVHFEDFNGDGIKDILIQNTSDVRSNWTYSLYLVDTTNDRLHKIRGFEKIKNPNYISKYNLIDNYVMSGRDWTTFYKMQGDSIKAFSIVIYDDHTDNGSYKKEYESAINKILTKEKNKR